jgi:hypothetical protein
MLRSRYTLASICRFLPRPVPNGPRPILLLRLFVLLLCFNSSILRSQRQQSLEQAAATAFSGASSISSAQLTGNAVILSGGTSVSVTATLSASSSGQTSVTLAFPDGDRIESKDVSQGTCATTIGGVASDSSSSSCIMAQSWVLPQLMINAAQRPANLSVASGSSVDCASSCLLFSLNPAASPAPLPANLQRLSQSVLAIDPATNLVTSMFYMQTPDDGSSTEVKVAITFSDYRSVSGVMVPFEIDKAINGNTVMKLSVTSYKLS